MNRTEAINYSRIPPRGLSRVEAAGYIGVSPTTFDKLVADGRMPAPKRINARTVWDIRRLDLAFDNLPSDDYELDDPFASVDLRGAH
jgi:predicted DNA-binding transcriptional regulator AlpA